MLKIVACVASQHDFGLVAVSAGICLLGCFSTVTLMAEAARAERRSVSPWLIAAAFVFGCSVWSLHFVAMLAFQPGHVDALHLAGKTFLCSWLPRSSKSVRWRYIASA